MKLEEYAAQHPQVDPIQEQTTRSYHEWMQDHEEAQKLKQSITRQLEQGNEPQLILYTALKVIGILTNDPEWTEAGHQILDSVYDDLKQQSLIVDNAAIEAERLEKIQADYTTKLRRQLIRQLSSCKQIESALKETLQTLEWQS